MTTVEEALGQAVGLHRAGRLAEAGMLYRRILEVDRTNFNALHLLGLVERQAGNLEAAIALITEALRINPAFADAHANLGNMLRAAGRSTEAVASYRRAIILNPAGAGACYSLGSLFYAEGGAEGAIRAIPVLRWATHSEPRLAEAHHDLGLALRHTERLEEAIASQRRALALKPDFVAACMNLGNALLEQGDRAAARHWLKTALVLSPGTPESWYNLGNSWHADGALPQALDCFRRTARLGVAAGLTRAGAVLIAMDRLAEAETELCRALPLPRADVAGAIEHLTGLLIRSNRQEEARQFFTRLAEMPLAGVSYAGECLTALATLDLAEGQPQAAAARLARVSGDNCRFFTVKSLAALSATLAALGQGVRLVRPPNPDPARPRVTSSTLATHGRFAHNALEYILVRLYAEKYGYVLETPDWVGGWFFELDDPPQSSPLNPFLFSRRIINQLVAGTTTRPPVSDCDILSPLFLLEHKEIYRERVQSWLRPRAMWRPFLDPALERLRAVGNTVVAIHIRRGDFVQFKYPITETDWYVTWLREIWPRLERPVLYLASDDLTGVRRDFAEFRPLVRADVIGDWPGLDYLQDFHVLMHADVVGISAASGFSLLAARLNTRARLCVEPDVAARQIRPFSPWTA